MAARTAPSSRRRALGMTLVEILVGVAIGLIGIVAIFQAVAVWSKHTSTTSSGGDAQVAGTLALFNLERDLKQAGHGFAKAAMNVLGCNVSFKDNAPARVFNFGLRPVDIAASAGGAPDTITILYGDSSFYGAEGTFNDSSATTKKLRRRTTFKRGDIAVVAVNAAASAASADCQLIEITKDDDPDGYTVGHTANPYDSFYLPPASPQVTPRFNGAAAPIVTSGTMYNLGPQPRLDLWAIQGNRTLTRTDLIHATTPMQIADGVVNLKAEYGIDSDGDGTVSPAEWTASAPADWRRLQAIRVAILVRSRQYELHGDPGASGVRAVTPDALRPFYFGDPVNRRFRMTNLNSNVDTFNDVTADPNNWRFYRYRVYERVIPLRNMLWGTTE